MLRKSLIINPTDTVAMVLEDALKGDTIQTPQGQTVTLLSDVEFAHKVSILDQKKGDPVIKYAIYWKILRLVVGFIPIIWTATVAQNKEGPSLWKQHLWDTVVLTTQWA